jgi:hypothetical protein
MSVTVIPEDCHVLAKNMSTAKGEGDEDRVSAHDQLGCAAALLDTIQYEKFAPAHAHRFGHLRAATTMQPLLRVGVDKKPGRCALVTRFNAPSMVRSQNATFLVCRLNLSPVRCPFF